MRGIVRLVVVANRAVDVFVRSAATTYLPAVCAATGVGDGDDREKAEEKVKLEKLHGCVAIMCSMVDTRM